jgi:hypothetical protein
LKTVLVVVAAADVVMTGQMMTAVAIFHLDL